MERFFCCHVLLWNTIGGTLLLQNIEIPYVQITWTGEEVFSWKVFSLKVVERYIANYISTVTYRKQVSLYKFVGQKLKKKIYVKASDADDPLICQSFYCCSKTILAAKWETHFVYFIFKTISIKSFIVLNFLSSILSRVKHVSTWSLY